MQGTPWERAKQQALEFQRRLPKSGQLAARLSTAVLLPAWPALSTLAHSLSRIARSVSWFQCELEAAIPDASSLSQLQHEIESSGEFQHPDNLNLNGLVTDFPVLSALIDSRSSPPKGAEQLRALLVLCVIRWGSEGAHATAIGNLTGALRNLKRQPNAKASSLLAHLPMEPSLDAFESLLEKKIGGIRADNARAAEAITHFLHLPRTRAPRAVPPPEQSKGSDPPSPKPINQQSAKSAPRGKAPRSQPRRYPPRPVVQLDIPVGTPAERGESPEEARTSTSVVESAPPSRKPLLLSHALLRATQRILTANSLLLSQTYEVLSESEAIALVDKSLQEASLALATHELDRFRGHAWLLLMLVTGRSAATLAEASWSQLARTPSSSPQNDQHTELRVAAIEPPGAFIPDEVEQPLLVPTVNWLELTLPPALSGLIQSGIMAGAFPGPEPVPDDAAGATPTDMMKRRGERIERLARGVLSDLRREADLHHVTLGRTRRTLASRIFDATQDLALTMLVCGDSFGLSTTPLFYASISQSRAKRAHADAVWPTFGATPPLEDVKTDERIGSRLLVRPEVARTMARAINAMARSVARSTNGAFTVQRRHNLLVDHLSVMLITIAGHRPTDTLFALQRFDLDPDARLGVFSDKAVDAAHLHRVAVLADILAEQIRVFDCHLRTLATHPECGGQTRGHAAKVLAGRAPLLFHLDRALQPVPLTLSTWRRQLPPCWAALPLNWGRTFVASHLRDRGVSPDLIHMHLGHLEATAWPFSQESPFDAVSLATALSGDLNALARDHGWQILHGLKAADSREAGPALGPLRSWRAETAALERRAAEAQQWLRQYRRSLTRASKDCAVVLASRVLAEVTGSAPPSPLSLDDSGLTRVQERIDVEATDVPLRIAAHNQLYRILRDAKKRGNYVGPVPGPWLAPASVEPTSFFPGMMRACAQIHALRLAFQDIPRHPPEGSNHGTDTWAFARATLAVVVFGLVDDPDRLVALLENRNQIERLEGLPHVTMVPTGDEVGTVLAQRGLGALALAALARSYPSCSVPASSVMESALAEMIPSTLRPTTHLGLLQKLHETAGVCRRLELSGAARLAMDQETGSASMPLDRQQRLFLDTARNQPDVARLREGESTGEGSHSLTPRDPAPRVPSPASTLRKQYLTLVKLLPLADCDIDLPRSGKRVSLLNREAQRSDVATELELFAEEIGTLPLPRALALWAARRLRAQTKGKSLAYGTVATYLTSIGGDLVRLCQGVHLTELDELSLTDLYLDLISLKCEGSKVQSRAARELLSFHTVAEEVLGLPSIDVAEFGAFLRRGSYRVDADVVLSSEYQRALAEIDVLCNSGPLPGRREFRQTKVFLILLRHSGARFAEIAGLRLADVIAGGKTISLFIRPSRYRRLKTRAARRRVDLSDLPALEHDAILEWIRAERSRAGTQIERAMLFSNADDPCLPIEPRRLREHVQRHLRDSTDTPHRIHRLRHTHAHELIFGTSLAQGEWRAWGEAGYASLAANPPGRFPRPLRQAAYRLGHTRPSTSLRSYFHTPWALEGPASERLDLHLTRVPAAVALGISIAGADKILLRSDVASDPIASWLNAVAPRQGQSRRAPQRQTANPKIPGQPIGPREVLAMLRMTWRGIPLDAAACSLGWTEQEAALLRQACTFVANRVGFGSIDRERPVGTARNNRPILEIDGEIADRLVGDMVYEQSKHGDHIRRLGVAYLLHARRSFRERLFWPRDDAGILKHVLKISGWNPASVQIQPLKDDIVKICVARSSGKGNANTSVICALFAMAVSARMLDQDSEALGT